MAMITRAEYCWSYDNKEFYKQIEKNIFYFYSNFYMGVYLSKPCTDIEILEGHDNGMKYFVGDMQVVVFTVITYNL